MRNIDALLENIYGVVKRHALGNGAYARYLWQNEQQNRKMGINEYGCADAVNILYTLGRFPTGKEREEACSALLSLQHEDSGLFVEGTHHPIHTTAHCTAALELFDQKPLYPQKELSKYFTVEGLYGLLDSLDWVNNPWSQSHQGAGIYAIGVLTDSVDTEWQRAYFQKLWDDTDDVFGMSKKGTLPPVMTAENRPKCQSATYSHLYGWFHYTFNMEYAKKPQRYPEKLIDTCMEMYDKKMHLPHFGRMIGFAEVDWVYVLNRCTRQTPYRFAEAKARIRGFADRFLDYLESLDYMTDDAANDLHMLFGTVCCLAELQAALPGEIESTKPLRLVLDRRPFI